MELYPTKSYVNWGPAMGKAGRPGQDGQDGASIVGPEGPIGPAGPGTGAGAWQPSTAYTAGQVVQAPDGSIISRNATSSSRPTFDATERTAWTAVSAKTGTIENDALATAVTPLAEAALAAALADDETLGPFIEGVAETAVGDAVAELSLARVVFFGDDLDYPRPAGAAAVLWIGVGVPVSALDVDLVIQMPAPPPPPPLEPDHEYLPAGLVGSGGSTNPPDHTYIPAGLVAAS